jgi:glycosyltransferase involved in cell wall biosynthesis
LRSRSYLLKGHDNSIRTILKKANLLLPNSELENIFIENKYGTHQPHQVIPLGVNTEIFANKTNIVRDSNLILSVGRIEGIKNQLNLIKALQGTPYKLMLIGKPAPNQLSYYKECRKQAGKNVSFIDHIPQKELSSYYYRAKVHVLPSWFETCGLSSLEAAYCGCNIVVSERGFTRGYFGNEAFYCEPGDQESIRNRIELALKHPNNGNLSKIISSQYTWDLAAEKTFAAYQTIL